MIFCFDIDGTISSKPEVFKEIMSSLLRAGHEVFPLTAMQANGWVGTESQFEQMRIDQLKSFGIEKDQDYTDVVVCVSPTLDGCGELKGQFCNQKNVAFMVEDTKIYSDQIKKYSPNTLCLGMPSLFP